MWKFQDIFAKKDVPLQAGPAVCILCVDDNEVQRRLLEKTLSRKKYRVLLADNGETSLEIAKLEKPDLILMDIVLPGIDGIEACRRLKSDPATQNIPVLFLTGSDTPQSVIDCYEFGGENYLSKSISPGALLQQIDLTLKEQAESFKG